jgi:hypothetical protein
MSTFIASFVASSLGFYLLMLLLVFGGILFYTLYKKGDVLAEVSHGRTVFKLQAKEKHSDRK